MNIYSYLVNQRTNERLVLATIIKTSGSTPQVSGTSALFSEKGLVYGTIGGGVLENTVIKAATKAVRTGNPELLYFHLDSDITDEEGAICGGSASVLIDACPEKHEAIFSKLREDLAKNNKGVLVTLLEELPENELSIHRYWLQAGEPVPEHLKNVLSEKTVITLLHKGDTKLMTIKAGDREQTIFIEPVFPDKRLLIVGGGHVGQALSHLAGLLGFEVTIVDNRAAYAEENKFPDAHVVIHGNLPEILKNIQVDARTYIVIATHAHKNDADALRECLHRGAAYIGMIGSRRKVRLIKNKFIQNKWATKSELDEVHAPVGLDIGSETVQEIAVSIAAELIMFSRSKSKPRESISIVILAAGASKRMGEPKMLLPYGNSTIIETVVERAIRSKADHITVVTGAHGPVVRNKLSRFDIDIVVNPDHEAGMLSSVQTGIKALPEDTRAVLILLGDQPMVETGVINHLIDEYHSHAERIVIPVFKGKRGHPLLLDMSFKPEIENLDPEKGLRQLLADHPGEILETKVDTSSILKDIDTIEDYVRMKDHDHGTL